MFKKDDNTKLLREAIEENKRLLNTIAQLESVQKVEDALSDQLIGALATPDSQNPLQRVHELVRNERKLHTVAAVLSGQHVEALELFMRQVANRIGLSSIGDVNEIYARLDALQELAVSRDELRRKANAIQGTCDFIPDDMLREEIEDLLRSILR